MATRKIIKIDEDLCTGCGQCIIDCAEGALELVNGKATVIKESFCDGLGACLGSCPEGALEIIEREADPFDEVAVEEHLAKKNDTQSSIDTPAAETMACGCPGSMLRVFEPAQKPKPADANEAGAAPGSHLNQWPVQLRLLPVDGPLYAGKNLLLLADCVAVAYPDLQRKLVDERTVVMTCPKLDDANESIAKLAKIFANPIGTITCAIMEVPCCSGLLRLTQEALSLSGRKVDVRVVKIGIRGEILEESQL